MLWKGISWQTMSTCKLAGMSADVGKAFMEQFRARVTLRPHVSRASRNLTAPKSCALLLPCRREGHSLLLKGLFLASSGATAAGSQGATSCSHPSEQRLNVLPSFGNAREGRGHEGTSQKRTTRASTRATTTINFTYFPEIELTEIAPYLLKWNSADMVANGTLLFDEKKNYKSLACL